jgi:Tol biopolymer transport system component
VAIEQLTNHPAADRFPRPRPGNPNQIAFASNRRGNWDLWLLQIKADGPPEEILLTDDGGDEIDPAWSPDGQFLAFTALGAGKTHWSVHTLQFAAKIAKEVTGDGFLPDWHPRDPLLVFQRARQRPPPEPPWYGLWTITTGGGFQAQVVSSDAWGAINPCWSPDGEWIAFASVGKGEAARRENRWQRGDDIWIVRADGRQPTQLTTHEAPDWAPAWVADEGSPSGRIYFTSERGGPVPNIWSVRPILPDSEPAPPK